MAEQEHLGALYGAIAVFTYCGILAGGPLLALTFSWGMRIGGMWMGLPFLVAAGLFSFALMAVSFARLRDVEATDTNG